MKYFVTLVGRTYELAIDGSGISVDGRTFQAHLDRVPGTPLCHLMVEGQSYSFAVIQGDGGEWTLLDRGERFEIQVLDERTRHIRSLIGTGRQHQAAGPVKAPMPGLVVKLLVEPGQSVEYGQSLVVLEAMKMENELKAPGAGVVTAVTVKPGQAVEKGQPLVLLQPAGPA